MAALAASVALGYFVIAILVAPRIKMPSVSAGLVFAIRGAAVAFFIGCGATHIHILVHALETNPQPVETHEIVFHSMQAIGAWLFIAGSIMRLELHIVPSPQHSALKAAVEEQRRLADRAVRRASEDELTGLARRWRFDEALDRQVALAGRHGTPATLLLVDVDGLKRINDTLGHQAGDRTLRHIAAAIHHETRQTDLAARIGGDEFAIILLEAGEAEAAAAAARIIATAAEPGSTAGIAPRTTVSAGSAPIDGARSAAEVLRQADLALYAAKRRGGNCHAGSEITASEPVG
ncbi:MAG: GGDEF domain-containing protein [Solirubrobacteraceae bacterium]|nr:GGDEF domain-containing protein [Solirubrobacteraceae bacterium]